MFDAFKNMFYSIKEGFEFRRNCSNFAAKLWQLASKTTPKDLKNIKTNYHKQNQNTKITTKNAIKHKQTQR